MNALRIFLIVAAIAIYAVTAIAVAGHGLNWPAVAIGDLMAGNWRSQFDVDFILYLLIVACWICWREGGGARGLSLGVISIVMGGMFAFPYLLLAITRSAGDPLNVLMGVHARLLERP
ncbi:MAG: hypothetical protein AAGG55_13865 [Pseudomonadota bacterium]